jgi:hypothetical protein
MAQDFSFDVVSEVDLNLVGECVQVALKEITNRFDFRGANVTIELNEKEKTLTVQASDEFKVKAAMDIFNTRMAKRGLPIKNFTAGEVEAALGATARMKVTIQSGIPSDKAKEMVASLKKEKIKANAAIQGDQLRVTSKSKDALQEAVAHLKGGSFGLALQFKNYR